MQTNNSSDSHKELFAQIRQESPAEKTKLKNAILSSFKKALDGIDSSNILNQMQDSKIKKIQDGRFLLGRLRLQLKQVLDDKESYFKFLDDKNSGPSEGLEKIKKNSLADLWDCSVSSAKKSNLFICGPDGNLFSCSKSGKIDVKKCKHGCETNSKVKKYDECSEKPSKDNTYDDDIFD